MINMAKLNYFVLVVPFLIIVVAVNGRSLKHLDSSEMISDGVDNVGDQRKSVSSSFSSFLIFKNMDYSSEECEPLYGFLPCSTNVFGYLFLIVIYEYLLFHGESYVASGSERIFKILGPGVFGASAFHVLGALPEALIVLAIGLMDTTEKAQEHVYTVVGLLAGTTILNLTLVWGTCVIVASQKKSDNSVSRHGEDLNSRQRLLSSLTGSSVTTDIETNYTARIMVMSVIPYIIMQIPKIFNISSEDIFISIALIVSLVFLAFYFFYQIFRPWIQKRRWEVVNTKHLISEILQNVRKQALEKILTDDGAPNVNAIKGLFKNIDGDGDNNLTRSEVKELISEINKLKRLFSNEDKTIEEVMNDFDIDGDSQLNMDEFVDLITKWLDQTKGSTEKSLEDLHEVLQPWIENKRKERETKNDLMSEILRHLQSNARGNLLKKDGTPNVQNIKRLFEKLDRDKNNYISLPELKEVMVDLKFGNVPLDADETVEKIMKELDTSEDGLISQDEFVIGVSRWLRSNPSNYQPPLHSTTSENGRYKEILEETQEVEEIEGTTNDRSLLGWVNAIMLLACGIGILSFLAEPLINSVQNFSEAANISSFFIGFILVPFATNARGAISAITEASRKKSRTTSLTFSEIYGGVIMNNIMNFSALLAIIYVRGLTWEFSGEVLVVLIVCASVGLITSFRSTYPIWASAMAFILYPLSLLSVYVLDDVFNYS